MHRSLFPGDDSLPTWLHSLALLVVVSPFGAPLIWWGIEAIHLRHLEPLSGPDFGQFFFGPTALNGKAAVWAGLSLVALGASFYSIAVRFMRPAQDHRSLRWLPWVLLAVSIAIGFAATPH